MGGGRRAGRDRRLARGRAICLSVLVLMLEGIDRRRQTDRPCRPSDGSLNWLLGQMGAKCPEAGGTWDPRAIPKDTQTANTLLYQWGQGC